MKGERHFTQSDVDLALAVLCALRRPGETLSLPTIAHVVGMSTEGVRQIQERALKKLRNKLTREAGVHYGNFAGNSQRWLEFAPHRDRHGRRHVWDRKIVATILGSTSKRSPREKQPVKLASPPW
jgi:hypothetical protein